jgi:biotin carboxylase
MNVLIINIGWEQERLVKVLNDHGANIYAVHSNNDWNKSLPVRKVFQADYRDLTAILNYAHEIKPEAIVADQCDYSYFASAFLSEALGLPGPSLKAAQRTTNKWIQRETLRNSGVPQPRYELCRFFSEAENAASQIGYPVIVKPIDNRGSFGVSRVNHPAELSGAYQSALANAHSRLVLIEEFIHGVHITIDGYVFSGIGHRSLALASKTMLGGDKQVAMEILYPGDITSREYASAIVVNDLAVEQLGLSFGMTHAEYMIDSTGTPYLIEIANRGGGVLTSSTIIPEVSGIDVTRQLVLDALGLKGKNDVSKTAGKKPVCLSFFRFQPGTLSHVSGADSIEADAEVLAFKLTVHPGELISTIDSDAARHGFVITTGKTPIGAKEAAARVKGYLTPHYKKK